MQLVKKESQGKERQDSIERTYAVLREEAVCGASGQAAADASL